VFARLYELGQEPDNQECLDALKKRG